MRALQLPGLATDRCLVMGVVNVTPDSFSDGGKWFSPDRAIEHGVEMMQQGATFIDVGGESTRPGAARVSREEELHRVVPVVKGLAAAGALVSVDTMWAETAAAALDAGAVMINDVSGGRADAEMLPLAAKANCPFVVMHWRAHSETMQDHTDYDDVVADVISELGEQIERALAAGVSQSNIVIDPGLGFSKTGEQNWELLAALPQFEQLGYPLLVAASRKTFLGTLLARDGEPRPPAERDAATAAISVLADLGGAWCVRVHDVPATADALAVSTRFQTAVQAGWSSTAHTHTEGATS